MSSPVLSFSGCLPPGFQATSSRCLPRQPTALFAHDGHSLSRDDCTFVVLISSRLNYSQCRPSMLSPRPPQVALPTSTITIKPHDDETAPNLPNLRIQVFPQGLVVNSPPLSSRPDTKALAHALKVFVPLNGKLHIKISLDLCSLGDHQSLRLRDEAIQTLDSCLRDVSYCPEDWLIW